MIKNILVMMCLLLSMSAMAVETNKKLVYESGIIVFVSLSMPRQSLIKTMHDANKIRASVAIRGLVNDSFKTTYREIGELVKEAGGGGIELNPLAFERFQIDRVPAVVVITPNHSCLSQNVCDRERDYDVMSGNITLAAAMDEISQKGTAAPRVAAAALTKLQESHDD